jgi:hypothetical protein
MAALALSANAAVTVSDTAPAQDGADIYNLTTVDASKIKALWTEKPNGQSFTTPNTAASYSLDAISIQIGAISDGNEDGESTSSGMNYSVQVYEMNLDQSPGLEVSNQPVGTWTNPGDVKIAVYDWMTFSLNTAVSLEANKQYGIRITHINGGAWSNGTPRLQASTNNFSGGTFFANTDVANTTEDLVFHANITAVPEPSTSTSALLGLGGITLILRP